MNLPLFLCALGKGCVAPIRWAIPAALSVVSIAAVAQNVSQTPPRYVAMAKEVLMTSIAYRTVEGAGETGAYAEYLAGILEASGFTPEDVIVANVAGTATLTATFHGESSDAPILLSGHMDVVEADRDDWERDPFVAVEENGFIYGRGAQDMKFGVTMLVVTMARLKEEDFVPERDVVLVLSGDEETTMSTTAVLAEGLGGAGLLLNADAGGGRLSEDGAPIAYYVQAAEKSYADFRIEFVNPGGHSSRPHPDNAIYNLARALARIEAFSFPVQTSPITLRYLSATGAAMTGPVGDAIRHFVTDPTDTAAISTLRAQPEFVGQLGTTCVATLLEAGHAANALPQRATANVNCRIFPGGSPETVRQTLENVIDDPNASVTIGLVDDVDAADPSPLREDVLQAVTDAIEQRYPGLPVVPSMSVGATDSLHFRARGVPSYGVSAVFTKASDDFAHGLNERVPVANIGPALDHWHVLITELAR